MQLQRRRVESGAKIVEEADYRGYRIRVVCGYHAPDDEYVVHLYIALPGQPATKVFDPARRENTEHDALDLGFGSAREEIDFLSGIAG